MKILLLLTVILFIGCSQNGQECYVWKIKPGKDSLVAAYVQNTLSTIKVNSRNDDEDWDDFAKVVYRQAALIYGYNAKGVLKGDGGFFGDTPQCICEGDSAK